MAASIFDGLGQLINSGFGANIAKRLGEPEQNISRGLQAGSTSILAGIANKSGDAGAMKQVYDLISSPAADIRSIDDPAAFAEGVQSGGGIAGMSSRFLSDLFGSHSSAVNDVVAKTSGLSGQSVTQIMRFAAPLVLGFLGRHVRQGGLNLSSFTRLLSDEKSNIMRAAPAGLASALGHRRVGRPAARSRSAVPGSSSRHPSGSRIAGVRSEQAAGRRDRAVVRAGSGQRWPRSPRSRCSSRRAVVATARS